MNDLSTFLKGCLVACCLVVGAPTLAVAQEPTATPTAAPAAAPPSIAPSPEYTQALQRGNQAYNKEDYAAAIQSYTQAIQLMPQLPDAYRNMARAYFWNGSYDASLAYYDTYLTAFPSAADLEQIQKERRLTSDRTSKPWQLPEEQRVAMRNLESALNSTPIYARGGGGAWQAYQALLRTGYAQPSLTLLRARLIEKLLQEHDQLLQTRPGQTAPLLEVQDWELESERVEAARKLATSPTQLQEIERRAQIHAAAQAMLSSRYEEAARLAERAIAQNPDALYLRWFYISALMRANKTTQALQALDLLEGELKQRDALQLEYAQVTRAMLLQRLDRNEEAADLYTRIFKGE